jgi:hypothetical protein
MLGSGCSHQAIANDVIPILHHPIEEADGAASGQGNAMLSALDLQQLHQLTWRECIHYPYSDEDSGYGGGYRVGVGRRRGIHGR